MYVWVCLCVEPRLDQSFLEQKKRENFDSFCHLQINDWKYMRVQDVCHLRYAKVSTLSFPFFFFSSAFSKNKDPNCKNLFKVICKQTTLNSLIWLKCHAILPIIQLHCIVISFLHILFLITSQQTFQKLLKLCLLRRF